MSTIGEHLHGATLCRVPCWLQGAESEACPCFTESLKAKHPVRVAVQSTIADGVLCVWAG